MRGLTLLVFIAGLLCSISIAAAEPQTIEVAKVEATFDQRTNAPVISIKLSESSAKLLAQVTQDNIGRVMHLRVDGKIVASPVVREPILAGQLQISGNFTVKEAKEIADSIRAALKIEIEPVR